MRVMKIEIANSQSYCRIKSRAITALVLFFVKKACGDAAATCWQDITLHLTDNAGIKSVNKAVFSSNDVTDVISSTYSPIPGEESCLTGEIVVNAQRAVELTTAKRRAAVRWTASEELALYIAHGCDHLSGEDDNSRTRRERMRRRELRWLKEARDTGMLNNMVTLPESRGTRARKR
jgi:rRNA maturation RNase YbeY